MKIVFWGSSPFSMPSLELLAQKFTVAAVVTNADASCGRGMKEVRMTPVKEFALAKGLPVLQPCDLKDPDFAKEISAFGADLFAVVSYGMILPLNVLEIPSLKSVNLHASLLPAYRGASPIQTALVNGDKMTGVTVQHMSKEMDRGDVIFRREEKILPDDNYVSLSSRLADAGAVILAEAVEKLGNRSAPREPQDEAKASYTRLIRKEDGKISFIDNTAEEIYNKWRGYISWPGVFTFYNNCENVPQGGVCGDVVYLTDIELVADRGDAKPGTIVRADKKGLIVACKSGSIGIRKLKPAGKKEMDAASFQNGYRAETGRYF